MDRIKPDEPYRYKCPDCGTERIEEKKLRNIQDKSERLRCGRKQRLAYYCRECLEPKQYVIDKKRDAKRE